MEYMNHGGICCRVAVLCSNEAVSRRCISAKLDTKCTNAWSRHAYASVASKMHATSDMDVPLTCCAMLSLLIHAKHDLLSQVSTAKQTWFMINTPRGKRLSALLIAMPCRVCMTMVGDHQQGGLL